MNRQGLLKLLQSELSDEDVMEILKDVVCKEPKNLDMYRPLYQPLFPQYEPYNPARVTWTC